MLSLQCTAGCLLLALGMFLTITLAHDLAHLLLLRMQNYMSEMDFCLGQMSTQMNSNVEARLHQMTFEAFMLAEETFRMRALDNNAKAMSLCRHQPQPKPGHVYANLLVSQRAGDSYAFAV